MKNKLTIISQFEIAGALLGLLSFAGVAMAQMAGSGTTKPAGQIETGSTAAEGEREKPGRHTTSTAALSAQDKTFIMNAAKGGMMEVQWGKAASDYSKNPDVKKFGKRMMADHSKANNELIALAKRKGVALGQEQAGVKWRGDLDYMNMMVDDHEKDLKEFTAEATNGNDPDVKKFAADTAKVVNQHLLLAKQVRMQVQ